MSKPPFPVVLLLLLISSSPSPATCASSFNCNVDHYMFDTTFAYSLMNLFHELVDSGSAQPGKVYSSQYDFVGAWTYGSSLCSGSLTVSECRYCLQLAVAEVTKRCYLAVGGQATLEDCSLRYEQYKF